MIIEGKKEKNLKCHFNIEDINTESFQAFTMSLAKTHGASLCFRYYQDEWVDTNYIEFSYNVEKYAKFFTHKKLTDKNILIISESRPEVIELFTACFAANATSIPIDIKLSPVEMVSIIEEVNPEVIFTTKAQYHLVQKLTELTSLPLNILAIDKVENHYSLSDIPYYKETLLPQEDTTKTGIIIYTSGSTGKMKGVETSGSQLLFQVGANLNLGFGASAQRTLSMLPMNHLFETTTLFSSLSGGFPICVAHSLEKDQLQSCFQKHKPTQMFTVPLFCKSIMNGVYLNISDSSKFKKIIFRCFMYLSKYLLSRRLRRKLFAPIHEKLGGKLTRMIIGGAAVDIALIEFFELLGITIYEGYGLTETAPIIAVNRVSKAKAGSVGPVIPGIKVKIDQESGEILTKGPHVMRGYYKDPEGTKQVLSKDGWFKTGDIGYFDKNEMLHISGRIKNLIILESGKKVHPEELLNLIGDISSIEEASIFGINSHQSTNCKGIAAVIYLRSGFREKHGNNYYEAISKKVDAQLNQIAAYKRPTHLVISEEELPKTPSMKVKHFIVSKKYHAGEYKN